MTQRREGPFTITKKLGPVTYELKLPDHWKIHNRFHIQLLMPMEENNVYGEIFMAPPPELINGEEEYEVEGIMKHRDTKNGQQYYIRWKGYPPSEDSWEDKTSLENSQELLERYKKDNKLDEYSEHVPNSLPKPRSTRRKH